MGAKNSLNIAPRLLKPINDDNGKIIGQILKKMNKN